jgi:hypothetical protein
MMRHRINIIKSNLINTVVVTHSSIYDGGSKLLEIKKYLQLWLLAIHGENLMELQAAVAAGRLLREQAVRRNCCRSLTKLVVMPSTSGAPP